MPGFSISGGEAAVVGETPTSNTIETRRKHRWVFITLADQVRPQVRGILLLLKSASRPKFALEEPEMHHNQEKVYFAGKQSWETVTLTWYDGEQDPDVSENMWDWVNNVVDIPAVTVDTPAGYKRTAQLAMLDGAGSATETWALFGCWPKEINWGDLDYTDTEIATVEVVMRYDRAERA